MPLPERISRRLAHLAAFNPAGGVNYHLRARRHAKKLWEPFRWSLGQWLLGWSPPEPNLVLVGPSAGYNLQPFLFERFERVVVLEPDPIARWLFRRHLARVPLDRQPQLEFRGEDHLVHHPERLLALLATLEPSALLFANVLGQITMLLDAEAPGAELEAVKAGVRAAMSKRSWASFHDRVSGPLPPDIEGLITSPRRWSDADVLERAYHAAPGTGPVFELDDHHSEGFFPEELPHHYLRWELEPGSHHLIEAVASVEAREGARRGPAAR
jgi:hypothetical protein